MKKVLISRNCRGDGQPLSEGQEIELRPTTADQLIRMGYAVEAKAVTKKPRKQKTAAKNADESVSIESEQTESTEEAGE